MDYNSPIDCVIIGAGPSGLAAAIYTTRENITTVLFDKGPIGGLAAVTDKVDNYPGFPEGIAGLDLADHLQKQAERFGAQIRFGEVEGIHPEGEVVRLTVDGNSVAAKTVLIATGSDYNKLGVPGEQEYYGRGVHYCATCDGAFYAGKDLIVVGGGNSAVQESIFLTRYARHIDLLVRSTVKASEILQRDLQQYLDSGQITVHTGVAVDSIMAENGQVTGVRGNQGGQTVDFRADGVFVFIGLKPNTGFLINSGIDMDEKGLIKTDSHLRTNLRGVFASGDVRSGATMQIASAVGEGATAALSIREYLDGRERL